MKKQNLVKIKQFVVDAVAAFVFYTLALTPYMLLVVRTTQEQYVAWLVMQAVLVPPVGAVFAIIARKIKLKSGKK